MDNEKIFLDFWRDYKWPEPKAVLYRIYYDADTGRVIEYSHADKPGSYIDVSPEIFSMRDHAVTVVDQKLVPAKRPGPPVLRPSDHGVACHPDDVCIVSDMPGAKLWSISHEQN